MRQREAEWQRVSEWYTDNEAGSRERKRDAKAERLGAERQGSRKSVRRRGSGTEGQAG